MQKGTYNLSPTALNLYRSCPRCFYLAYKLCIKHRGIVASITNGIDEMMKHYTDNLRASGAEFANTGLRFYYNQNTINVWRNYKQGIRSTSDWGVFFGAVDDVLYSEKRKKEVLVPFDFKTKGAAPQDGYGEKWYALQLSIYAYLFSKNGYKTADHGYLMFISPMNLQYMHADWLAADFQFNTTIEKVSLMSLEEVEKYYIKVCTLLDQPNPPYPHSECSLCLYTHDVEEYNKRINAEKSGGDSDGSKAQ